MARAMFAPCTTLACDGRTFALQTATPVRARKECRMKKVRLALLSVAVALGTAVLATVSCSDDSCPGIVCSDCSGSGDCDITCDAGEQEFCGNFGFFEDPTLRCAYCEAL
jgi:hypothetical protein